jgi:hypothetical protein
LHEHIVATFESGKHGRIGASAATLHHEANPETSFPRFMGRGPWRKILNVRFGTSAARQWAVEKVAVGEERDISIYERLYDKQTATLHILGNFFSS